MAHIYLCYYNLLKTNLNYFLLCVCVSRGKDGGGAYNDLGEFDQALFLYLDGQSPNSSSSLQQHKSQFI